MIFKLILTTVLSSFIATSATGALSIDNFQVDYVKKPRYETTTNQSTWYAQGSAFFITPDGYLATAAHVVEGAKNIIVFYKNKPVKAKVIVQDTDNDVAILKVNLPKPNAFFELSEPRDNESALIMGFPSVSNFGFYIHTTQGPVKRDAGMVTGRYSVYAKACHGNSGGVIANLNGDAIGILVEGYPPHVDNDLCSFHSGARYLTRLMELSDLYKIKYIHKSNKNYTIEEQPLSTNQVMDDIIDNEKVVFVQGEVEK